MSITSVTDDRGTSSRGTRILGTLTLIGTAVVAYLGLVATGPDVIQRDSVRRSTCTCRW